MLIYFVWNKQAAPKSIGLSMYSRNTACLILTRPAAFAQKPGMQCCSAFRITHPLLSFAFGRFCGSTTGVFFSNLVTAGSTQGSSTQPTSYAGLPPGSEARRIALSQALLQALTEGGAEDSQSSIGNLSDSEFREQLADFIEMTNNDINDLRERVSRLEALINR